MGKRYMSMREIASLTRRREGLGPTLRSALRTWTRGAGMFIVLFASTTGYIAFRGGDDAQALAERFARASGSVPAEAQPHSIPALALGMRDSDAKEPARE